MAPYPLMKLNTSYIIIDKDLPYIRPFELITRGVMPTSEVDITSNPTQQRMLSTLRSQPVTCCTQGRKYYRFAHALAFNITERYFYFFTVPLRVVQLGNNTFVTWSLIGLNNKKYFIIQFSVNNTSPDPQQSITPPLMGTTQIVNLNPEDIYHKLVNIEMVNATESRRIIKNAMSSYSDNDTSKGEDNIFNLVLYANVTGLMLNHFTRLKLRVLLITSENENLSQDFRYVEWKSVC